MQERQNSILYEILPKWSKNRFFGHFMQNQSVKYGIKTNFYFVIFLLFLLRDRLLRSGSVFLMY